MKKIIGFILIGIAALILILNVGFTDGVTVNLLLGKIHTAKSIVMLASIALGAAIGLLMK